MINPVSAATGRPALDTSMLLSRIARERTPETLDPQSAEVQARFQDFVGGTFYKTLLKSLRDGQHPPKYFHGGQAEEIFQGQLDEQLTDDLARQFGAPLAAPLFEQYSRQHPQAGAASPTEAPDAFDAVA